MDLETDLALEVVSQLILEVVDLEIQTQVQEKTIDKNERNLSIKYNFK